MASGAAPWEVERLHPPLSPWSLMGGTHIFYPLSAALFFSFFSWRSSPRSSEPHYGQIARFLFPSKIGLKRTLCAAPNPSSFPPFILSSLLLMPHALVLKGKAVLPIFVPPFNGKYLPTFSPTPRETSPMNSPGLACGSPEELHPGPQERQGCPVFPFYLIFLPKE